MFPMLLLQKLLLSGVFFYRFDRLGWAVPAKELKFLVLKCVGRLKKMLEFAYSPLGQRRMSVRSASNGDRSGTTKMRSLRSFFPFRT
jgi:hypothetical protein